MNNTIRITVPLRLNEFEKLRDIANSERRHTREQAAYMLGQLLGVQPEKNKSVTASNLAERTVNGLVNGQPS